MKKTVLLSALVMTIVSCNKTPQLGKDSLDDVINAMTLEEKVHFVIGTGMEGFEDGDSAVIGETRSIVPGAAGTTYPIERLGIPAIVLADGPAGLRINPTREGDEQTYYCTHFPIGTLLASTWNPELVEEVGNAIGNEVLEYGVDVLLAPALNIHRNPLNGRNFEYYSEDPLISGKIAAAYVKGVQKNGVGTSIKHFAANNQETNRMGNDARISPRALREIYLKGFETAVKESQPWTVMSSYNYVNGEYTSENPELLTEVLRDEWGYDGVVMTDWFGGKDAVKQMKAGNEMLQPGYAKQGEAILGAVQNGELDEAVLDQNVRKILELILQTPRFKGYKYSNKPDLEAHAKVTRQSATEGMVLLKNDNNTLPLNDDTKNVALFGVTSYEWIPGGTGSGNVNRAYTVSLLDGFKNAGYTVDEKVKNAYDKHIASEKERQAAINGSNWSKVMFSGERPVEMNFSKGELDDIASTNDLAVITIGRNSGEFFDRKSTDFTLTKENKQLIDDVTRAFHNVGKKVVIVLNVGGVVETESWKNKPDAILLAWQGGQEGGNSVVDILKGDKYPSGKLTMTFPKSLDDHYSTRNFPVDQESSIDITDKTLENGNRKDVDYTNYEEDIYVGYRYFDSFDKEVSYPFGYGLSYTEFEYGTPQIDNDGEIIKVSVPVKNVGKHVGKEVVQLYVSDPNSKERNKPSKELRAFYKTKELSPGEEEIVVLSLTPADLASFDEASSSWVVDEGDYDILIGASSRDIRDKLTAAVKGSSKKTGDVLHLKEDINRLKR
ncbi:MAG: glycoside hydrolase family 3 C-terminal domain-containing protein [Muribaculaceae bacterium]|nr:glycoside hydrolase family 3 C-terminal domain-containing protein [Muribaculaceae bacterium]